MRALAEFQEQAAVQKGGERKEKSFCSHGTATAGGAGEKEEMRLQK